MRRGFTIHHNGPPAQCIGKPHARCVAFWGAVKAFHTLEPPRGQGWSDIAYSFGVCPHGERFVGRGWDKNQFANGVDLVGTNNGPDSEWYTVLVFVGGGPGTGDPEEVPTDVQVDVVAQLIAEGRNAGRCGNQVKPHSDWKRKPCPGPTFTALARQWDGAPLTTQEDDMTPDECRTVIRQEIAAIAEAVDAKIGTAPSVTRSGLHDLFARDLAAPSGRLHQGVKAAVLAAVDPDAFADDIADVLFDRLAPMQAGTLTADVVRTEMRAALAAVHAAAAAAAVG